MTYAIACIAKALAAGKEQPLVLIVSRRDRGEGGDDARRAVTPLHADLPVASCQAL